MKRKFSTENINKQKKKKRTTTQQKFLKSHYFIKLYRRIQK